MISGKNCYDSIQRQSRCADHVDVALVILNAAGHMLMIRVSTFTTMMVLIMNTNDDTDNDTDDDTYDNTDDHTDDGGRGNLYTIKVPGFCSWVPYRWPLGLRSLVLGPAWAGSGSAEICQNKESGTLLTRFYLQ